MNTVWIAGRWMPDDQPWEVLGIFDSEDKADAACKTTNEWIAPVEINALAPDEPTPFPSARFPRNPGA